MNLAVANSAAPYRRHMSTRADPTPREQRDAMAKAIRTLREQAGPNGRKLTTLAAAANIGRTRQTWEKYENAKGDAVLRQDVQAEIAKALGVTRQELLDEYQRTLAPGDAGRRQVERADRAPATLDFAADTTPPADAAG
jgi:transcriptional regulator with XRE-family HTH domain